MNTGVFMGPVPPIPNERVHTQGRGGITTKRIPCRRVPQLGRGGGGRMEGGLGGTEVQLKCNMLAMSVVT